MAREERRNVVSKISNKTFRDFMKQASAGSKNLQYGINYYINQNDKQKFSYQDTILLSNEQSQLIKQKNRQFDNLMQRNNHIEKLCLTLKAKSSFISGLGASHVTETGINLHSTYGVPFLPGTMLKGIVNQWLYKASKIDAAFSEILLLTGLEEDEVSGHTSSKALLHFHDCFFSKIQLKEDIMTPHFQSYYGADGKFLEEDQTNPVKFKAVEFQDEAKLWITWDKSTIIDDKEKLAQIIIKAIEETGMGAKTNVGYGAFEVEYDPNVGGN